jgi:hypothetical protein
MPPMRVLSVVFLLGALYFPKGITAQVAPAASSPRADNAAMKYLRADVALRQSYELSPDAAAVLENALRSPLTHDDEKLVAAAKEALAEFRHGTILQHCNWELSSEDGPLANTSHRGAVQELAAIFGLRARLRFRDGDSQGAMTDAVAAIAAARHLSVDGTLTSVLIAYRLESAISELFVQDLHRLSVKQLQELLAKLDSLPVGSNLHQALQSEEVDRNDLLAIVQGSKTRDDLIEHLLNGAPALHANKNLAAQIVDGCGGSVKKFDDCIDEQHAFYVRWARRFTLPPEQFEAAYNREVGPLAQTNTVVGQFTPALPRFRWSEAYSRTRRALLKAAIAVELDGARALTQYPDPYDGKPFSYIPVSGGFRLESRLRENGNPLSISILSNPKERPAQEK